VEDYKFQKLRFLQRRKLLAVGIAAPLLQLPSLGIAADAGRELAFSHTHTGERLRVTYFEHGQYLPDALTEINYLLRDFRTAEVVTIDPELLDLVHLIKSAAGSNSGTLEIISGYRSPATNEMLRNSTSGVAKKSFHMSGQAIDIRLTDISTSKLRDAATSLGVGGVGYYAASDFLHVDTGPARQW
jgi:uncharacterized protein YcbK (DUF882 family)